MLIRPMDGDNARSLRKIAERIDALRKKLRGNGRLVSSAQRDRLRRSLERDPGAVSVDVRLERLIGGNDLQGVQYLTVGAFRARSVCRIVVHDTSGDPMEYGTGFLVAPGVLMTNQHVIRSASFAGRSVAQFDYELDASGRERTRVDFKCLSSPTPITVPEPFDFALVAVEPMSADGSRRIEEYGYLTLNPTPGKAAVGEYLTIIQHPNGERKQVCVRENKLLEYDDTLPRIIYATDTVGGSSGSPVFNDRWQVVALHRAGFPRMNSKSEWLAKDGSVWKAEMGDEQVDWVGNEGVRISKIIEHLEANFADLELSQRVIAASRAPAPVPTESAPAGEGSVMSKDGELSVTIPVRVSLRVGDLAAKAAPARGNTQSIPALGGLPTEAAGVAVSIDDDYSNRRGYQESFLGARAVIPFPKPARGGPKALAFTWKGKKSTKIDYFTYSVMMHATKKLALVSAVNIETDAPHKTVRPKTTWRAESERIVAADQLGKDAYDGTPFDYGHLSKSEDCAFGADLRQARLNAADSFHLTNAAPQLSRYNQSGWWSKFENWVVQNFAADGSKISVFNGPIFDAPRSSPGPDGKVRLNLKGRSSPDPVFTKNKNGKATRYAIPKLYYKIGVYMRRADGKPAAAAFILSQEDGLAKTAGMSGAALARGPQEGKNLPTDADVRYFQVSVAEVERATGLDFGPVRDWDALTHGYRPGEAARVRVGGSREVFSLDDLVLL
jgi:endonuclease G